MEEIINNKLENSESEQKKVDENTNNYIEAIKEMKANSVSKEAYVKLQQGNKQLLNSLVNGQEIAIKKEEPVDINKLREKLFSAKKHDMTNLDYVTNALKLREALMKEGQMDPFVQQGKKIHPTDDDFKKADKVATVLQECVDYADGDAMVFTDELKRRIN